MPVKLSVNLNKIALLRNSRGRDYPSLLHFAKTILDSSAIGITLHPRPDQRHARYSDVHDLAELLIDYPGKELNVEGNPTDEFMRLISEIKPHQCTLVPDKPDQITSDHGWNLESEGGVVKPIIDKLKDMGVRSSLFMDPQVSQVKLAAQTGADRVELYSEEYAVAFSCDQHQSAIVAYQQAALTAAQYGLAVNAGHDLNLDNLAFFLQQIKTVEEVSIGHAIISESLEQGFMHTLNEYLSIIDSANQLI